MPTTLQCQDIIFNLLFLTTNSGLFRRGVRGRIVELHDTFIGALWRRLGRRSGHSFEARTYITFVIPISRRVSWLRDQWSDADGTVTLKSAYLSRWKHRHPDGFRRETTGAGPMLRMCVGTLETLKGALMYGYAQVLTIPQTLPAGLQPRDRLLWSVHEKRWNEWLLISTSGRRC